MVTQAVLFTGVGQVSVEDVGISAPGEGELLVETVASCISPGTELRCLAGRQAGQPEWPFIPGYASVARVIDRGPGALTAIGSLVVAPGTKSASVSRLWGAHLGRSVVNAADVFPIPAGVSAIEASATKLAAIAYRGVRLAAPSPHHTVAVIGLGVIGQLSARLFHATGARVVACDRSAWRVSRATDVGIEGVQSTGSPADAVRSILTDGADIVVDCTGSSAVLSQSLLAAKDLGWGDRLDLGPTLVLQGSYADNVVFDYDAAFRRELTVKVPRDTRPADFRAVLDFLQRDILRIQDLLDVFEPIDAPEAYRRLSEQNETITGVFKWVRD
jgi:2-desacetyl-2-hydroxyethyl bacteriochlorophyllide A dehydrogenase